MSEKSAARANEDEVAQEPIAETTGEPLDSSSDETQKGQEIGSSASDADAGQVSVSQKEGSVKNARFAPLAQAAVSGGQGSMDLLLDVSLDLSVELGSASIPVREILQLGPGSIIELDKLAGDAVDIMVNGKLIAKGEVVVVDESFGVRVSEIASATERLTRLA